MSETDHSFRRCLISVESSLRDEIERLRVKGEMCESENIQLVAHQEGFLSMVDEMKNEIQGLNAARREDLKKWEGEMRTIETNYNQEIQQVLSSNIIFIFHYITF